MGQLPLPSQPAMFPRKRHSRYVCNCAQRVEMIVSTADRGSTGTRSATRDMTVPHATLLIEPKRDLDRVLRDRCDQVAARVPSGYGAEGGHPSLPCLCSDDSWCGRSIVNDLHLENELQILPRPLFWDTGRKLLDLFGVSNEIRSSLRAFLR